MFGQAFLDLLIVCSDIATSGSFVAVFAQLRSTGSASGLSLQTLLAVVSARCLHIFSHGFGLHYVPAVLPWIVYPILDACNSTAGLLCFFTFFAQYYHTYERAKDNFGIHIFEKLGWVPDAKTTTTRSQDRNLTLLAGSFLYIVVAIGALCWYNVRRSQHSFALSYFCCFYEVMSGVALIPQLWMFHQDKRVSPPLANFVVLTAVNRLCTLSFWVCYPWVYHWRYPDNRGIQMASESLNLLILSDFLFYWVRAKMRGETTVVIGDGLDV